MAVMLFPISNEVQALAPATLDALARLGVTSVSLFRDDETAGLVLEGWTFDPARAQEAASAFVGTCDVVRTLRPLVQMAVSSALVDNQRRQS